MALLCPWHAHASAAPSTLRMMMRTHAVRNMVSNPRIEFRSYNIRWCERPFLLARINQKACWHCIEFCIAQHQNRIALCIPPHTHGPLMSRLHSQVAETTLCFEYRHVKNRQQTQTYNIRPVPGSSNNRPAPKWAGLFSATYTTRNRNASPEVGNPPPTMRYHLGRHIHNNVIEHHGCAEPPGTLPNTIPYVRDRFSRLKTGLLRTLNVGSSPLLKMSECPMVLWGAHPSCESPQRPRIVGCSLDLVISFHCTATSAEQHLPPV